MLPLIISCTRSWNFAWHLLWRLTTASKNIVKPLTISQTIHTVCCEGDYFPRGKFKLFNSLFHLVYLVFPKRLFSIANLFAVRFLWVVCNEDKCCVVTHRAADIHAAWLVYVRTYCVAIATLNHNKPTRFTLFGRRPNNKEFSMQYIIYRSKQKKQTLAGKSKRNTKTKNIFLFNQRQNIKVKENKTGIKINEFYKWYS